MNKLSFWFSTLLLVFCTFASMVYSQNIKGGIVFGMNATQVDGDRLAGFNKFGFNTGAIAIVPIKGKFSASLELLYSEKGSRSNNANWVSRGYTYHLKLNYIDVPVLLNYQDKEKVSFGIGGSINTLVRFKEYQDGIEQVYADTVKPYNKRDYSIIASGTYMISKHFAVNLRYSYSITYMGVRLIDNTFYKQYNNVVTARMVYLF